MFKINFGELRLGPAAKTYVESCLKTNWVTAGPLVKKFESNWGDLFNYQHNKAVSSGTDAVINLISSVYAFGAQRGDEIIVPALSFIATSNAVLAAGLTPVFVDVEKETLNIDPSKIEAAITKKTRAILVVHTMGLPCDMEVIKDIATRYDLLVFEDACEAHGAKYNGEYVGNLSDGAAFSFYTAHLINCGEGGMVSTNNEVVAKSVGCTRNHGREEGSLYFDHLRVGYNSKMNDLEASIGLEGVAYFWHTFSKRKKFLRRLMLSLDQYKPYAWFSQEPNGVTVCPHGFSITLKHGRSIKDLCNLLDEKGIQWKRNFGCIPTQHKAFEFMGHALGDFPNAEYIGEFGIHLGVHHYLSTSDVTYIEDTLLEYFETLASSDLSEITTETATS